MDLSTGLLLAIVTLLGLNRGLFAWGGWIHHRWVFWSLQIINFAVACALVTVGIPEFRERLPVINLLLGGLLVLHILTNNRRLQRTLADTRGDESDEKQALRDEILRRLQQNGGEE